MYFSGLYQFSLFPGDLFVSVYYFPYYLPYSYFLPHRCILTCTSLPHSPVHSLNLFPFLYSLSFQVNSLYQFAIFLTSTSYLTRTFYLLVASLPAEAYLFHLYTPFPFPFLFPTSHIKVQPANLYLLIVSSFFLSLLLLLPVFVFVFDFFYRLINVACLYV